MTAGVSATCGSSDGAGSATGPSHSALVLGLVYLSLQTYAACLLPACSLGRQARPGVPAVKPTLAAPLATIMFILFLYSPNILLPTRHGGSAARCRGRHRYGRPDWPPFNPGLRPGLSNVTRVRS